MQLMATGASAVHVAAILRILYTHAGIGKEGESWEAPSLSTLNGARAALAPASAMLRARETAGALIAQLNVGETSVDGASFQADGTVTDKGRLLPRVHLQ